MRQLRAEAISAVHQAQAAWKGGSDDEYSALAVDAVLALLGEPVEEFGYRSHLHGGGTVMSWHDGPAAWSAVSRRIAFRGPEEKFGADLIDLDAAAITELFGATGDIE